MSVPRRRPSRSLLLAIAEGEALRSGITLQEILGNGRRQPDRIVRARNRAMLRVVAETGCSIQGVCDAWGMCRDRIGRVYRDAATVYDTVTLNRLAWAHGTERALRIACGEDIKTRADLRAWRKLPRGVDIPQAQKGCGEFRPIHCVQITNNGNIPA